MSSESDLKPLLIKISSGEHLTEAESLLAFTALMDGQVSPAQTAAFLMGLRIRGESIDEITGAVRAMRSRMTPLKAPADAIDCCGTGGDHSNSLNVSTAVSFVLAGCGVPVAKHGNRAASSRSGAADILAVLGVGLDADFPVLEECLKVAKVCFMLAPRHHSAMRHVAPVRAELGIRTLFNLIGPLSNPAGVKRQLIGVSDRKFLRPLAEVAGRLGAEHVWVVHGSDGMDELTLTGPSYVAAWHDGRVEEWMIDPSAANLPFADKAALQGGDPETNRQALLDLLNGKTGAYRDIVLLNSAACLMIAGRVQSLAEGAARAADSIESGAALHALEQMVAISQSKVAA